MSIKWGSIQIQNLSKFCIWCAAEVQLSAGLNFMHQVEGHQTNWHDQMHNSTSKPYENVQGQSEMIKCVFWGDMPLHKWCAVD